MMRWTVSERRLTKIHESVAGWDHKVAEVRELRVCDFLSLEFFCFVLVTCLVSSDQRYLE